MLNDNDFTNAFHEAFRRLTAMGAAFDALPDDKQVAEIVRVFVATGMLIEGKRLNPIADDLRRDLEHCELGRYDAFDRLVAVKAKRMSARTLFRIASELEQRALDAVLEADEDFASALDDLVQTQREYRGAAAHYYGVEDEDMEDVNDTDVDGIEHIGRLLDQGEGKEL
jgi:hypothetical protein